MAEAKIWQMSREARGQSEAWIRRQYNAAIKAANDRIKTVTSKYPGRSQAYEYYVKGDLAGAPYVKQRGGATVFKALPRGATREQALEALRMAERFLGAKTSTARGITAVERAREQALNKMLADDFQSRDGSGKAPALTKTEAENILRWMGSEEGKAAKANYDSNQVREAVSKAVISSRGSGAGDSVSAIYNRFLASEQTLADWIDASEANIRGYSHF